MFYLHVCMHTMYVPGAHRGQKRAPDPSRCGVTNGCELSRGCWEPNLCPLQEQLLLTHEPSIQAPLFALKQWFEQL